MATKTWQILTGLVGLSLLAGCGKADLPGYYFEVTLRSSADTCNTPTVGFEDTFTYRLEFDGEEVDLSIDEDLFATGTLIGGCSVDYASSAWQEDREGGTLRWRIVGTADIAQVGGCTADAKDWVGRETVEILSSTDDAIAAGCSYVMDAEGTFLREVK